MGPRYRGRGWGRRSGRKISACTASVALERTYRHFQFLPPNSLKRHSLVRRPALEALLEAQQQRVLTLEHRGEGAASTGERPMVSKWPTPEPRPMARWRMTDCENEAVQ